MINLKPSSRASGMLESLVSGVLNPAALTGRCRKTILTQMRDLADTNLHLFNRFASRGCP